MTQLTDIRVPDIGDFQGVPVIEIYVQPGDTLAVDDSICTLESDKATLDIPSPSAGIVREVCVAVGDRVSQGSLLIKLEATEAAAEAPAAPAPAAEKAPAPTPAPAHTGGADVECDVLVLGAGPGGYSAAFRSADLGLKTVLVERYPSLGGVCLNVGCIPSKALLHVAAVMDEAAHFGAAGVEFAAPKVDLDKLRTHKEGVVARLTGGLAGMAGARKVEVVQGVGRFLDAHHLRVALADGGEKTIRFAHAIIAAGSQSVKLPFLPEDPRIIDSTGALALPFVPKRMLIIGGGIIGLEMATVYATLGATIDIVEMLPGLMPGADRDLVKVWEKANLPRFGKVMLNTRTTEASAQAGGIHVRFEGEAAPQEPQVYDLVLVAVGRAPNGKKIDADKAGVAVGERGFIDVDRQMRTNVPHIFAIGDIARQPMLAHKAVHEAHVAAEAIAGHKVAFDVLQIPSVAYTHPEIAWAGKTEEQLKKEGVAYDKGLFPWAASGRAIANGADNGFTKLLFDRASGRILGGGIVGMGAGDLISEVCLAIEMGADALDIGKTIHPHPTLGESIGMAAEAALGHCTDLPPSH